MRKPSALEIAVTAKVAELIRDGKLGIDYRDEDDCEIVWNVDAAKDVLGLIFELDRELVVGNWIDDLTSKVAQQCDLLVEHPLYDGLRAEAEASRFMPENPLNNPAYDLVAADRRRA